MLTTHFPDPICVTHMIPTISNYIINGTARPNVMTRRSLGGYSPKKQSDGQLVHLRPMNPRTGQCIPYDTKNSTTFKNVPADKLNGIFFYIDLHLREGILVGRPLHKKPTCLQGR